MGARRKLNKWHRRKCDKGDGPITQEEKPFCVSRTELWKGLVGNVRDCPSWEQCRENRINSKKAFCRNKNTRNLLSKVRIASAQRWGAMGQEKELGRHGRISVGLGRDAGRCSPVLKETVRFQ